MMVGFACDIVPRNKSPIAGCRGSLSRFVAHREITPAIPRQTPIRRLGRYYAPCRAFRLAGMLFAVYEAIIRERYAHLVERADPWGSRRDTGREESS